MPTADQSPNHGHERGKGADRRVLIIEDDPDQQFLLQDLITILGYDVRSATTASAGIRLARTFRPDVILCDIGLPDMNGYELAHTLRNDRRFQGTFIIAMSGYGQAAPNARDFEVAFDRHLVKPVEIDTLDRLLAELTDKAPDIMKPRKGDRPGPLANPGAQSI